MRNYETLPSYIQKAIDFKERCERAREMARNEKHDDEFFHGASTDQSVNYDRMEINSWITL